MLPAKSAAIMLPSVFEFSTLETSFEFLKCHLKHPFETSFKTFLTRARNWRHFELCLNLDVDECWKVYEGTTILGFHEKSRPSTRSPAFHSLNEAKVAFVFVFLRS